MHFLSGPFRPANLIVCFLFLILASPLNAQNSAVNTKRVAPVIFLDSTKEQDGLVGPVRRVQTETAKLEFQGGKLTEGQRQLLEVTTYDLKGARVDNESYPVAGTAGTEEYKYDDKGNIIEMTLRSADGSIVSREVYSYETDAVGNWIKMTTSLLLFEDGKLRYEPVEVTYRSIAYFYDEKVAKLLDSKAPVSSANPTASESPVSAPSASTKNLTTQPVPATSPTVTVNEPSPKVPKTVETKKNSDSPEGISAASRAGSTDSHAKETEVSIGVRDIAATGSPAAKAVPPKEAANAPESNTDSHKQAIALYKSGREQFNLGNLTGAVQAYQQAIQIEPKFADVYLSLGHAYLRLEKPKDAIKAFKESLKINPDMEEAYYGLGLEYFRAGNMKDAAEAFKNAIRVRPNLAKAHYGLALAYQELGKESLLLDEYRILQTLDAGLAKKLSDSFPEFNLPCGGRRCD